MTDQRLQLFGTDGIRGKAGFYPLDETTIRRATASVLRRLATGRPEAPFLIVRDTRVSGRWIHELIAIEAANLGIPICDGGVMPTPAAAWLIPEERCRGGVVISASHNPAEDNGLKFLTEAGLKLPDSLEEEVEFEVGESSTQPADKITHPSPTDFSPAPFSTNTVLLERYIQHIVAACPLPELPPGRTVVFDCANGAGTPALQLMQRRMDNRLRLAHAEPNGFNINHRCGATSPELLADLVHREGAEIGFALDGDADRILAFDHCAGILDGDALLYIFATHLDEGGQLQPRAVVGTVMTNLGLESALSRRGISLERTPVGDRHIQARLLQGAAPLGGEPSGHIIVNRHNHTGDGIFAAFFLLRILAQTGRTLKELLAGYTPFPSRVINIPVTSRPPLTELRSLAELEAAIRDISKGEARLLVRYSGTEPLLRVLIEAADLELILGGIERQIQKLNKELSNQ